MISITNAAKELNMEYQSFFDMVLSDSDLILGMRCILVQGESGLRYSVPHLTHQTWSKLCTKKI